MNSRWLRLLAILPGRWCQHQCEHLQRKEEHCHSQNKATISFGNLSFLFYLWKTCSHCNYKFSHILSHETLMIGIYLSFTKEEARLRKVQWLTEVVRILSGKDGVKVTYYKCGPGVLSSTLYLLTSSNSTRWMTSFSSLKIHKWFI